MNKGSVGIVFAVLGIGAAAVMGSMWSKGKVEIALLKAERAEMAAELEAAAITARNQARNNRVVEQVVAVADPNAGELDRLKALVAQQRAQLAEMKPVPTSQEGEAEEAPKPSPTSFPEERTAENMKSFFDRMKEEDPERYQRMQDGMASMKERVTGGLGDRIEFFTSLDVSGLSGENMELLTVAVEKMNAMNQLMNGLDTEGDGVDAYQARGEMFGQMRELGEVMRDAREVLEADMIRGLGYSETETQELSAYLQSIQDMTSMRSMFRGGPGGGGGGGPFGGGRPAPTPEK